MARRKIFGKKTFSKKHKSRRGRKITSNKTRRFRGGNPFLALAAANTFAKTGLGQQAMNMATKRLQGNPPTTPLTLPNGTPPI